MIGFADKSRQSRTTMRHRAGRRARAAVWIVLVSWLFNFILCATDAVASETVAAGDSDLEFAQPQGSRDDHHPQQPGTDRCCTLQQVSVPADTAIVSTPLHDRLVAVLPLFLLLPLILFVPCRTRLHTTGPPGRSRHHLLVHSISPNAPPR